MSQQTKSLNYNICEIENHIRFTTMGHSKNKLYLKETSKNNRLINSIYGRQLNLNGWMSFSENVVTNICSTSISPDENPYSLSSLIQQSR
ncbi:hypothetical protein XIS1_1520019 [Xenorhabdus innexi]|uniref:Uncharacterized protein n=1 Tax=Xenorhabdus innexi TaxID=290109 RepID=A0A1N6MUF1_9GAMM|nr:hypothetical protein XIS1_1520019 [Xenorhabdus innexi]